MSQISQIIRRAFCTASAQHFYKGEDMTMLVQSFKQNTQKPVFRRKTSYYESTIQQLSRAKAFGLIEEILDDQKKYVNVSNEGFTVRLISLYGKSGLFDRAHQLFDEMPERNCVRTVKSFNALLGACVYSKRFDMVDGFFRELPQKLGIKPDVVSYNIVIKAFCEMCSLDLAASMLDEMDKEGVRPSFITFNTLFDAFNKKKRFLDGDKMWVLMRTYNVVPNIVSYNMRLLGFVLQEEIQEAIDLFEEIEKAELKPDNFTFNILLKALCKDRKYIEEAKKWYSCMMEANIEPEVGTFAKLLPFACDNGDFQFGALLCRKLFNSRIRLKDGSMVQKVIDGLVEKSNVTEAELLVQLGKDCKHDCYRSLEMPKLG